MILLARFQATFSLPKKKIFMGALVLSYNDDEQGFQTAMEYATEIINNRTDILKDYELVVRYGKTLVSISESCSETRKTSFRIQRKIRSLKRDSNSHLRVC